MFKSGACKAYQGDFRGWDAYYLENEYVRLAAVPDIGGRIMAYDLGSYPFLFVDPDLAGKLFSAEENQGDGSLAAWKNYGGDKTWPAPQGWENAQQWHGPPDPVLDTGRYQVETFGTDDETASIRMVSPPDERTGVQITRQFTITAGSSRVAVELSFTNISDRTVRWGIWDVTQLRAERTNVDGTLAHDPNCVVTIPANPNSRFERGFNVMFGAEDNPQWQMDPESGLIVAPYLWQIGKIGVDSTAGWIAFSQGSEGYAFAERFEVDADGDYPDDGATVECWTVGAGQVGNFDYSDSDVYLMETEVLGPMQTMAPGASISFSMQWGGCRCVGPIIDVLDGGCTGQALQATKKDGYLQLNGEFGTFDAGDLLLRWCHKGDGLLTEDVVGFVDPLTAIHLDRRIPAVAGAATVELLIRDARHGSERLLATAAAQR